MRTIDFTGRGIAFPVQTDATGRLAMAAGTESIEQAIRLVLSTAPGERPMRPEFGCRIHDHVFAPITDTTIGRISFDVERAVAQWEPRVDVAGVEVFRDDEDDAVLYISVTYVVKRNNDERNLVFPFYTIPGGAE